MFTKEITQIGKRSELGMQQNMNWFNIGFGAIVIRRHMFKLFNCFNRVCDDGNHWWGIGICQYGKRHLFYVGHSGVSILWFGKTL